MRFYCLGVNNFKVAFFKQKLLLLILQCSFLVPSLIQAQPLSLEGSSLEHKQMGSADAAQCTVQPENINVSVSVRILEATGSGELKVLPVELEDLRDKLSKLNFTSFKELDSKEKTVPLLKKAKLALTSGQTLFVRALYIDEDKRVGMWLRWKNAQGANLLDTRMHFACGESMVTGAESDDGQHAIVLAISVSQHGSKSEISTKNS